jgi:hypothetical protein
MQPPQTKPWKLAASLAGGALAALLPPAVSGTAAAGNTVTGTFVVVGTLSLGKTIPAGTTVSVEADANVNSIAGNIGSAHDVRAATSFTRTADKATVTLSLPYTWNMTGSTAGVFVSLTAVAEGAFAEATVRLNLPKNGETTEVDLPAKL